MTRRLPIFLALATVGCFRSPPPVPAPPPPTPSVSPAATGLPAGVAYLLRQQSPDGAWRSDVYATFKDGTALTPLVVAALQAADAGADERRKAAGWLAAFAKSDGTIDERDGLPYPVYAAALSVSVLSHPENRDHVKARDAWLKYLRARQLTEANGWAKTDKQYGGWGYYPGIPKKPAPGQVVPAQQLLESNLSATAFALDALTAAGVTDKAVWDAALHFVDSCQNPDGGYHFIYADPVRNKAGRDGDGGLRSYGSATADGIRAASLGDPYRPQPGPLDCSWGPPESLRGWWWLGKHFAADRHPGDYVPAHERNRNAVYFYYAASVARDLRQFGGEHRGPWAASLADALLARQTPDGSWANPAEPQRENDPVLATAYAVWALGECRAVRDALAGRR